MTKNVFALAFVTAFSLTGTAFADTHPSAPVLDTTVAAQSMTVASPKCVKTVVVARINAPAGFDASGKPDTIEMSYCVESPSAPTTVATSK